MKIFISILSFTIILGIANVNAQADSARSKNDKPGTAQSLRSTDQSPQSSVGIINSNTAPGQTPNNAATGTNTVSLPETAGEKVPTTPTRNLNSSAIDSSHSSAIRNGVSNTTNPIRNQ